MSARRFVSGYGCVRGIPEGTSHVPEHEQDFFTMEKGILLRQGWNLCCGHLAMGVVPEVLVWSACPWGSCVMWLWDAGPKTGWVGRSWGRGVWFLLPAARTVWSWEGSRHWTFLSLSFLLCEQQAVRASTPYVSPQLLL